MSPGETLLWPIIGQNNGLRLSPDGSRVAFTNSTDGNIDIWTKTLPNGPMSRLTFDEGPEQLPAWTPDGRTVTFTSWRTSESELSSWCCFLVDPCQRGRRGRVRFRQS